MSLEFLLTTFMVVASPGTGMIYTIATGLSQGWRASVVAACSCTLGILPHILGVLMGLAALLQLSSVGFTLLRYAGAAYLLWMAWGMLRSASFISIQVNATKVSYRTILFKGIWLNILNPKLSIFFLAFLPQFMATESVGASAQLLLLSTVFMLITFVMFVFYGLFAVLMRHFVLQRLHVLRSMNVLFSLAFFTLAFRLLWLS